MDVAAVAVLLALSSFAFHEAFGGRTPLTATGEQRGGC